jgi:hypothetical protein
MGAGGFGLEIRVIDNDASHHTLPSFRSTHRTIGHRRFALMTAAFSQKRK